MTKFEEVYAINVNDKTEKKGNLTYLSWSWAWAEFKKVYPDASYKIKEFDGNFCTGNEKMGYMVQTEVTAGEQTYEMWLPVMDMRNNTILQPKMTEINKAIMRCLTKNLAMFGLGLYIYAGEDLPETESNEDNEGSRFEAKAQNKPTNGAKPRKTPQAFVRLTKAEMVEKWGVKNAEQTIARFETHFGKPFGEWSEEQVGQVRETLQIWKEEREEKARAAAKATDKERPFDV